jgi:hypothetical protein
MYGGALPTQMFNALGENMDGNRLKNNEPSLQLQLRSQPLRPCDNCAKPAEPQSGVQVRDKWICGKCWFKRKK